MWRFKSIMAIFILLLSNLFISYCSTTMETGNVEKVVWLIEPQFDSAGSFRDGLASIVKDEKVGYINKEGRIVIPLQFYSASSFSEGLAAIKKEENGKWGYIDKTGKLVVAYQFYSVSDFSEGLAAVKKEENGKWGYINYNGKVVIPFQFDWAGSVSDGLICVQIKDKDGYMDKKGNMVIKPQYTFTSSFSEGYAVKKMRVSKSLFFDHQMIDAEHLDQSDGYFFINKEGKALTLPVYEDANNFSEGMALVKKDGKWGYIDKNNKYVIKPRRFDYCSDFHNGLAYARIKGIFTYTIGYIDKKGNFIIEGNYGAGTYDCSDFSEGFAVFTVNEKKSGYLNTEGKIVIEPQFESVSDFSEGFAAVKKGGKWGYIRKPQTVGN